MVTEAGIEPKLIGLLVITRTQGLSPLQPFAWFDRSQPVLMTCLWSLIHVSFEFQMIFGN